MLRDLIEEKREYIKNAPYYSDMIESVRKAADKYIETPLKCLPWSDFGRYFETGSRKEYERVYFDRRGRLSSLAVMYIITREKKYRYALEDAVWAVCDEYSWALPAHLSSSQTCSEQSSSIDLFAAETGATLSEIYSICTELSERVRERIASEVRRRIIQPYLKNRYWWERSDMNWAAVCGGCVGACFIYMAEEEFSEVEERLISTMKSFLSGYGNDGCCREGAGYWLYGFGYFVWFADILCEYTSGRINLFSGAKVKRIAEFQQHAMLDENNTVCFSDCDKKYRHRLSLSHFLRGKYGDIYVPPKSSMIMFGDDPCYRWAGLIRDFFYTSELEGGGDEQNGNVYFSDAQWYIYKGTRYSLAAKCGGNNEPHNHNDIGSFMLCFDGDELLCELGSGEYTADYFGARRYRILNNSSRGHSVPIINGRYQEAGAEYIGSVISCSGGSFEAELSGAYPECGIKSLQRRFECSDKAVIIRDRYRFSEMPESLTERFVSFIRPVIEEGAVIIGGRRLIYNSVLLECAVSEERYKDHSCCDKTAYFIDLTLREPALSLEFKFVIE